MKNATSNRGLIHLALLSVVVGGIIVFAVSHHAQNQGARTVPSTRTNASGETVKVETDYDDQGRIVEEREFYLSGKLRTRIKRTYLKGFKEPNISKTQYRADGQKIESTTNSDVDKDGKPTVSVTTTYDENGKENGGTKREHDKDGKEHCYKWNTVRQTYEEVDCGTLGSFFDVFHYLDGSSAPKPEIESAPGLLKVNFATPNGQIVVNLPDDMRAGDTISGTVVAEPDGQNEQERAQNANTLQRMVIDFRANQTNRRLAQAVQYKFAIKNDGTIGVLDIPIIINFPAIDPPETPVDDLIIRDAKGNVLGRVPFQLLPRIIVSAPIRMAPQSMTGHFDIPQLGQQGRPIVITGPFDGDSSNTSLRGPEELQKALEKAPDIDPTGAKKKFEDQFSNENFLKGLTPIAESPRQAIFVAPTNVTGAVEVTLREGDKETKGTFRSVGVNLTAPKTSLMKGESTTLKIEVSGLQGINQPIPLHLTNGGAVTMAGGTAQTMSIKPNDVQSNGTFTTTRSITAVRAGGWSATATVVAFNTCLEDDGDPLRVLLFNVATGDFVFCQGRGESISNKPIEISTFPLGNDFTGGVRVQAGDGIDGPLRPGAVSIGPGTSLIRNGTITSADFNFRAAQTHIELNIADYSGSATIKLSNPNRTFTIRDHDTRDNSCSCK